MRVPATARGMPAWTRKARRHRVRPRPPAHRSRGALGFEVGLPQIEINTVTLGGVRPPKLASFEANVVEVLRLIAEPVRPRVGKREAAMMTLNHSALAACIAGQASVTQRMHVSG